MRGALTQWLDWHRRHPLALAEDVALIEEIAREAGADTRPERLCRWWQQKRERQRSHLQTLQPAARWPMCWPELSRRSRCHLQQALDEDNRDWRERFVRGDADQRQRASRERLIDRAGPSTAGWMRRSAGWSPKGCALAWDAARWQLERERQQRDLIETLRALRTLQAPERERRRTALLQAWSPAHARAGRSAGAPVPRTAAALPVRADRRAAQPHRRQPAPRGRHTAAGLGPRPARGRRRHRYGGWIVTRRVPDGRSGKALQAGLEHQRQQIPGLVWRAPMLDADLDQTLAAGAVDQQHQRLGARASCQPKPAPKPTPEPITTEP